MNNLTPLSPDPLRWLHEQCRRLRELRGTLHARWETTGYADYHKLVAQIDVRLREWQAAYDVVAAFRGVDRPRDQGALSPPQDDTDTDTGDQRP